MVRESEICRMEEGETRKRRLVKNTICEFFAFVSKTFTRYESKVEQVTGGGL